MWTPVYSWPTDASLASLEKTQDLLVDLLNAVCGQKKVHHVVTADAGEEHIKLPLFNFDSHFRQGLRMDLFSPFFLLSGLQCLP
jgi:hypothetical protein